MDSQDQSFSSDEEIYALMATGPANSPSDQPEGLRAGSEPPPGDFRVVYPGHPPFSHGSMGMGLLNSGFDVLPVANRGAGLTRDVFGDAWDEPLATVSPDYGPPSSSSFETSSIPDWMSEASTVRQTTATSPQEDFPGDTSSPDSPWVSGSLPDEDYQHMDSGLPSFQSNFWSAEIAPMAGMMSQVELPSGMWAGGWSKDTGRAACMGQSGYGYRIPIPEPAKPTEKPQSPSFHPATFNTERPQRLRTNRYMTRYEDGEVLRYGAGESYRPFNNGGRDRERSPPPRRVRSPMRARSPIRDRDRDLRARTPPIASDSYVPNRSPRRRSRSPDRYRGPDRARDMGGESWRRRDNSRARIRSPVRRISPRRSPRRSPGRFSPGPRRDDRFDRARSPRRDFDIRDR